MKIISWNVNGLRAVIRKGAIFELLKKEEPDIICLQEIKCLESDIPSKFIKDINMLGYNNIHIYSAHRKGYSGTAVFTKQLEIKVIESFSDNEGRIISCDFDKFILINIYVPNTKSNLSRLNERINHWEKNVRELLVSFENKYKKPIIITGDFNVAAEEIDLKNYSTNRGKHGFTDEERAAFKELLKTGKGYIDTFRELHPNEKKYTWFSPLGNARVNGTGWRIDYFITSKSMKNKIAISDILSEYTGSDHIPINLTLK
jgi:exodeoxyribonuclease-3